MSSRIVLTRARATDVQFLAGLYEHPQIWRGHGRHEPIPPVFFKRAIEGLLPGWEYQFVIRRGVLQLGHCGLQDYSKEDRRAELIVSVVPEQWGRGVGTAAVADLLDWVMRPVSAQGLGVESLWAGVYEENKASARLLAKSGFLPTGTVPGYFRFGPKRSARVIWAREGLIQEKETREDQVHEGAAGPVRNGATDHRPEANGGGQAAAGKQRD